MTLDDLIKKIAGEGQKWFSGVNRNGAWGPVSVPKELAREIENLRKIAVASRKLSIAVDVWEHTDAEKDDMGGLRQHGAMLDACEELNALLKEAR